MLDPFGLVGRTIAEAIRVDSVVAEGGFGIVYRGFHKHFRAPVALKCLKVAQGAAREVLEQFRREAEIQFLLSSVTPHVVRPVHFGEVESPIHGSIPIMALEWLDGMTLGKYIAARQSDALPPVILSDFVDLLGPIARAIHLGHNLLTDDGPRTVVHRDLKPENIFVANIFGERVVKVLDFGISKMGSINPLLAGEPTEAGLGPFSPHHGAPEQWAPLEFGQTGPWTDVWGLALILVEIVKGSRALSGGPAAIMYACLDANRRPTPRNCGVSVSDAVEDVFLKALAVDPCERYGSVLEFWSDLRSALSPHRARATHSFQSDDEETLHIPRLRTPRISMPTHANRRYPSRIPTRRLELYTSSPSLQTMTTDKAVFSWPPSDAP